MNALSAAAVATAAAAVVHTGSGEQVRLQPGVARLGQMTAIAVSAPRDQGGTRW
jgi:hypothetical protein